MEQSRASRSAASESCSTCRSKVRARLRRSAFWTSLARGICHKYTTRYDIHQSELDFRRNRRRRSNSKLSFAFGESLYHLAVIILRAAAPKQGLRLPELCRRPPRTRARWSVSVSHEHVLLVGAAPVSN